MGHHVTREEIILEAPLRASLVVYEAMSGDRSQNPFGLLMSHYAAADCASWMRETGFSESRAQHLVGPDAMVVGIE